MARPRRRLVFTVGVIRTGATAAISVIPGEVSFTLDMRSLSADTCERFHQLLLEEAAALEKERGVRFDFDKPLYTAPGLVDQASPTASTRPPKTTAFRACACPRARAMTPP